MLSNAAAVSAAVDLKQGTIHVQANAAAAREAIDMPQAPSICHAIRVSRDAAAARAAIDLQINGCTPRTAAASRGTWMVPRWNQWLHATHGGSTHGGSIAWHMDGASFPTNCLHTRRQHCVAHGWCPASITQWLHATHGGSIAWHMDEPRFKISCCMHRIALTSCCIMGSSDPGGVTPNSCQERPTTSDWAVSASLPPS